MRGARQLARDLVKDEIVSLAQGGGKARKGLGEELAILQNEIRPRRQKISRAIDRVLQGG